MKAHAIKQLYTFSAVHHDTGYPLAIIHEDTLCTFHVTNDCFWKGDSQQRVHHAMIHPTFVFGKLAIQHALQSYQYVICMCTLICANADTHDSTGTDSMGHAQGALEPPM